MAERQWRSRRLSRLLAVAVALLVLAVGLAVGERSQKGDVIVFLKGEISPLTLPREDPAPIAVRLEGGLETADRGLLPRVTRLEIGLPAQGVLSAKGLPRCRPSRLRDTKPGEALAACRAALVGRGRLQAFVQIPNQAPFELSARLLAFNSRVGGRQAVTLHGYAADPPTVVVLPLLLRRRPGRFGLALAASLSPALGPWPRLASFNLTLSRRYAYRGKRRSYLSASCPIPPRSTAGFFSLARVTFTLASGRRISTAITRGCRAR
jgi:hypothetical protein